MAKRKTNWNKCEASGYRLVGRDFYSVKHIGDKTICNCCGKEVKVRQFNGMEFIPAHNVPAIAA